MRPAFSISIDEPKCYDMKFGGAKQFVLSGHEGEKIRVRPASDTYAVLRKDFKVKIDDIRKRINADNVIKLNGMKSELVICAVKEEHYGTV